jgi:predicted enzyme related to lactoylglutathione lyase
MAFGANLIVYPVKDRAQAKVLYGKLLGVDPYVDGPYYVGFRIGDQELGLDPNGHASGQTGPIVYWRVDDIKASLQELVAAGAEVQKPVTDVGRGLLIAWVKDGDGNTTGLRQEP